MKKDVCYLCDKNTKMKTTKFTEGKMNLQNSNQGSMKRPSFLSTISILILNIEETLFKTVH